MIVVYGREEDAPLGMTIDALREMDAPFTFVDQCDLANAEICLELDDLGLRGTLTTRGRTIALEGVTAVYARLLDVPAASDVLAQTRSAVFQEAFIEWLNLASALVVNRPAAMESNSSKPYQAQLIAKSGFSSPHTLITNDPAAALAFRAEHGRIIYKSISGVRSIVREFGDEDAVRLDNVRSLPVQFQVAVDGVDVRVHVVGRQVFATEVTSDATDYRYAARDGKSAKLVAVDLPGEVAERCVALSQSLALPLCGIDLRRTKTGEYVCFEVNPMPAFSYYQASTGAPIAEALAQMLVEASHG